MCPRIWCAATQEIQKVQVAVCHDGELAGLLASLVLVELHSWQAQSSHLCRTTSVILTVGPALNWAAQCSRQDTTSVCPFSPCIA